MSTTAFASYLGKQYDRTGVILSHSPPLYGRTIQCVRSSNINAAIYMMPGQVVHATARNAFPISDGVVNPYARVTVEMGIGNGASGLPLYLLSGEGDFDVGLTYVPTGVAPSGDANNPLPAITAVPGTNGFRTLTACICQTGIEFETTEFDTTQTYVAGEPLRAVTSNAVGEALSAGKVTNKGNTGAGNPGFTASALTVGTDTIVGYVSRGKYPNGYQKQVLAYWMAFIVGTR